MAQQPPPVEAILRSGILAVVARADRILRSSARWRGSCEGWLKAELLAQFNELPGVTAIPELSNVDLTLELDGGTLLLELKTFPTNYGGGGQPITNFIQGVIVDLEKVRLRATASIPGYVLWLAYPIPAPVPPQWARTHYDRVASISARTDLLAKVSVGPNLDAHVYLSRCHNAPARVVAATQGQGSPR